MFPSAPENDFIYHHEPTAAEDLAQISLGGLFTYYSHSSRMWPLSLAKSENVGGFFMEDTIMDD